MSYQSSNFRVAKGDETLPKVPGGKGLLVMVLKLIVKCRRPGAFPVFVSVDTAEKRPAPQIA